MPLCAALVGLLLMSVSSFATPYAAAVQNAGGQVTFNLTEAADKVTIVFEGGARIILQPPPALEKGVYSVPTDGEDVIEIVVERTAAEGWRQGIILQVSSDTEPLLHFMHPRGVCVNRNPGSTNFGRIYVSMSLPDTNNVANSAEGIYMLGPDLTDSFGQGARTGGLDFAEPDNNALSPFRLSIGPDDSLYVCDLSTSTGTLYITDPNVLAGGNVFGLRLGGDFPIGTNRIRGSISAAHIEGANATSNLVVWVIDEDRQPNREDTNPTTRNSIWCWELMGETLPASNTIPVRLTASPLAGFGPQVADLARGPDGKFYVSQLRGPSFGSPGATTPGLFVLTPDGSSNLWNSLSASRLALGNPSAPDILTDTVAIDVSHDGKYIAVLRTNNSRIHILPLVNGLPDMTNRIHLATTPAVGPAQDIAFDAANNIYYVSSAQGRLRVLSPGGYSRAVTRTDGTFEVEHIDLGDITIEDIRSTETGVEIDFTFPTPAGPADFRVESTPSLSPITWTQQNGATITAIEGGFRATVSYAGEAQFYRIRR